MPQKQTLAIAGFCIILSSLIFSGCAVVPLKGNYNNSQYEITTTHNKDFVWNKLIEFCSQQGLSIKVIDKSSGLITFDKLGVSWSEEDTSGNVINTNAWIVVEKKYAKPTLPTAEWSLRVADAGAENESVITNLIHITDNSVYSTKSNQYVNESVLTGASTGTLEKMIKEKIE